MLTNWLNWINVFFKMDSQKLEIFKKEYVPIRQTEGCTISLFI